MADKPTLTDEDSQSFQQTQQNGQEECHGQLPVCIGQCRNILNDADEQWLCR